MTTQSRYLRAQNEADTMLGLLREIVAPFKGFSDDALGRALVQAEGRADPEQAEDVARIVKARAIIARIDAPDAAA